LEKNVLEVRRVMMTWNAGREATEVTEKEETIFQVMEIEHEMPV